MREGFERQKALVKSNESMAKSIIKEPICGTMLRILLLAQLLDGRRIQRIGCIEWTSYRSAINVKSVADRENAEEIVTSLVLWSRTDVVYVV